MIQYGGDLKTLSGVSLAIEREKSVTSVLLVNGAREPIAGVRLSYSQLLSLITRLTEAAKDATRES